MDSKIEKIIELCGFRKDPYWNELEQIFSTVTFENYHQILQNKDKLILDKIKHADARPITTAKEFIKYSKSTDNESERIMTEPLIIKKQIIIPEYALRICPSTYLGENVKLLQTQIDDVTWVEPNATVEYSSIQRGNGHSFIGSNTIVSDVHELKGVFISGGPVREKRRSKIYLHAFAAINLFAGAYSALSIGLTVYNHPLGNDPSIVINPETGNPHEFPKDSNYRKLPVLVGCEAELGANVLLNSGSIIGKNCRIPSQSNVDGLVYINDNGEQQYIAARPEEKL